jgi:DNA (cytosine-5)-methyltransferase 1
MRFVDLFCGIGGFHAALERLGHECVFASDIDKHAAEVYESNWGKPGGFDVHSDIRDVIDDIPDMDIICAGFPCQPFSKSGSQDGFADQTRGTLFHDICTLAEKHRPAILFLENVPNLVKHDNGNTMRVIESRIEEIGYKYWWKILSPHKYGTVQIRTRVYIVCIRGDLAGDFEFSFPKETNKELDIQAILDENVNESYFLTEKEIHWIETWEDFLKNVNTESQLPGHPIWAESFFGDEPLDNLPDWKQDFIRKNRKLYAENREFIDGWLERWGVLDENEDGKRKYPVSRTKYEWQAGPDSRSNWENLIQFRPSGIRVKRPNYFPALVAMAQIPVVGWERRHITPKECARIQNFDVDGQYGKPFVLGESDAQAYKQLGNAVNVNMVRIIQERIDLYLEGVEDHPTLNLTHWS